MTLRPLAVLALLLAAAPPARPATVGLVVLEDEAGPVSGLAASVATGALDEFFAAGHMAVGASVSRVAKDAWARPGFGLAEAREGYVDYLLAVIVDYRPSASAPGLVVPGHAAWRLTRVSDGAALGSGSLEGPPDAEDLKPRAAELSAALGARLARDCLAIIAPLRAPGGKP